MKRTLAILLAIMMLFSFAACTSTQAPATDDKEPVDEGPQKVTINLYSFTDEIPNMTERYLDDKGLRDTVEFNTTIIATDGGAYEQALDLALQNKEVDLYGLEAAFVLKYTQGDASSFAAPYEDIGIDVAKGLKDGEIAPFVAEMGTRPDDNKVVALAYQSVGGCFIFNDEVAKQVWSDYEGFEADPEFVANKIGAGSGNWDAFEAAADECKKANVAIVSGDGDVWNVVKDSSDSPWIVDGKLVMDQKRVDFIEFAKKIYDNNWSNKTAAWQEAWFNDMAETGERPVLGFYGPAWLVNYTIAPHAGDTAGQWRVCPSNIGFMWGGTWIATSQAAADADEAKKEAMADFMEWLTLDCTKDGLQYLWASGALNDTGTKDTVASNVVMGMVDGKADFLGGQNAFEPYMEANKQASARALSQYDQKINDFFTNTVGTYCAGTDPDIKSAEDVINTFKQLVADNLDVQVD